MSLQQCSVNALNGGDLQSNGIMGWEQVHRETHQNILKQCIRRKNDLVTQLTSLDDYHEQAHDKDLEAKTKFEFRQEHRRRNIE